MKLALSTALLLAFVAQGTEARADCTEAGACASNEYCATDADGGTIVTDGGSGVCVAQPCVLSSDCPADLPVCDTSQNPFKCVGCISTADCPEQDQQCNPITQTCFVPIPDAGPPDAGHEAGAADSGSDAALDATTPPATDASSPEEDSGTDASPVTTPDAGFLDTGTLNGGACDCATVVPAHMALGALGAPVLLALSFLGRRRRRRR